MATPEEHFALMAKIKDIIQPGRSRLQTTDTIQF